MADVSFTPRIWMTVLVDAESGIIAAFYLYLSSKGVIGNVPGNFFWVPSCLLISMTELAIDIESPGIEIARLCETSSVAKTC